MPVGSLIIKMQKQTAQSHKSGLANMNEQSAMFSGCLLLLLMRQQNVTLPQHQRRQMNNSLWKIVQCRSRITIQAPAEQVAEN